ncbi:SPOR domain-containing protein [Rhodobacteraceae bacterium SC52]|nr:SPOR domain-containing protein [Rhodobacteraceae bacterium SC52]
MILRALCVTMAAGSAMAQPAETPPAEFDGASYVDSAGCAFQRAELDGKTVWAQWLDGAGAPRCGLEPTVPQSASEALPRIPPSRAGAIPDFPVSGFYVQLGAFTGARRADRITTDLTGLGYSLLRQDFPRLFVLFAGPFPDAQTASDARIDLRGRGFPDAFLREKP